MAELLDKLPNMENFLGKLDLKTGSLMIAAICVIHPFAYGCTLFMPLSYLIFTIWILLALYLAASILLFLGLIDNNALFIDIWIWYSLVFVVIMVFLMILLSLVLISRKHKAKVIILILGILWYLLTVYFVLVVNSHRKTIEPISENGVAPSAPGEAPPSSPDEATPAPPAEETAAPAAAEESAPPPEARIGCKKEGCFPITKITAAWFLKPPQQKTTGAKPMAIPNFNKEIFFSKT